MVFESAASNLVAGDTNGVTDVFVRDTVTGTTERVSVSSAEAQATDGSHRATVSGDGRFVVFESAAANLVAGDTNAMGDIFVRDRVPGITERVSVPNGGGQTDNVSFIGSISADGRYVAFQSVATNVVGGDTNRRSDVFVRDRQAAVTTMVSVSSTVAGQQGQQGLLDSGIAVISADGRYVAFDSLAPNLVAGDVNGANDVFVHDRQTGATTRVSVPSDGTQGDPLGSARRPDISADGRYVTFDSTFSNLVSGDTNSGTNQGEDVFVHDRQTAITTRVNVASDGTQANDGSLGDPSISADGRYVSFTSTATNLVPGDTNNGHDVFVHDRQTSTTTRVSVANDGTQASGASSGSDLSDDGRYFTFSSSASNLVVGDTNGFGDVFVRDVLGVSGPTPILVAVGDVRIYEGDAGARSAGFTVSLSEPAASAVSVDYATVDGTATGGSDYTAKAGTLNFAPGTTSLKVKVAVSPDTADEANESFNVSLLGANEVTIADDSGGGTIVDDDPPASTGRRLTIGDVSVHEGDAGTRVALFNVSLSTPAASTVSVNYAPLNGNATSPADYLGAVGTLSFPAGSTSQQLSVTINPDTIAEGNQTFTIVLSGATGPKTAIFDGTGVGTIIEDD